MDVFLRVRVQVWLAAVVLFVFWPAAAAFACPFCCDPTLTLVERYSKADIALLAKCVGGEKPSGERPGHTKFEVLRALREDPVRGWSPGDVISITFHFNGKPGEQTLLLATTGDALVWDAPIPVTDALLAYIRGAPSIADAAPDRLAYFLGFLEAPEQSIANDAYAEFSNARYEDIVRVARKFPRERIRSWLNGDSGRANRIGLYGLMLGLCGNDADAHFLEALIAEQSGEDRLGMDGIMAGYLLLRGEAGLEVIERATFQDKRALDSETYAALQAVRFLWTYTGDRVKPERLLASLRLLLDNPKFAELVIADLARWKDWSILDRLLARYGTGEYDTPRCKAAVIGYLLVAAGDAPSDVAGMSPQHVRKAHAALDNLRKRDPEIFRRAERSRN